MKNIYDDILTQVTKKDRIPRLCSLAIGTFLDAFIYNSFIVPNGIVLGGIGGLGVIANKLTGFDPVLFYNLITLILVLISLKVIGLKKTSYTIVGYLFYALWLNVTKLFASSIQIQFESYLMTIMFYAALEGTAIGLINKTGFNTGGMDSVYAMILKYIKLPKSKMSNVINSIIIGCGMFIFGITKSIYALIYLMLMNFVMDRIILGSSLSKICFIKSKKLKDIEMLLTNDLNIGYTLIDSTNGISFLKKQVIMCVVPTDRFYYLRKSIMALDKKVEIITSDCYTVEGGHTNRLINVHS